LFERALSDPNTDLTPLTQAFAHPRIPDELLTREAHATLAEYYALGPAACTAIRPWVQEMCQGMARYARIHSAAHPGRLVSLTSIEELDSYCYYVAGTVGHLLTELFSLHSPRVTPHHYQRLKALSTSFGLGLQLTNIIKDVADDRQRGWSFVPTQLCSLVGVTPEALLEPEHQRQARIVMDTLISKAKGHLNDALAYCTALPRSQYKIRLFCLTPLYFAVRTLALAERDPRLLDPTHKVKITRGEVYRTLCATYIVAPSNHLTAAYFRQLVGKRR
jgi:farnesyl-diphosphate farnesyltransferase